MAKKITPVHIFLGFSALFAANLMWAPAGAIIKFTLEYLPPYTFLFLRFLMVSLLLLPFTIVELIRQKFDVRDVWKVFLLGVFSQSAIILIFLGLEYTTAVDSAILGSISVLMSMTAGHYFFNEKVHKGVVVGLLMALAGSTLVILEPIFTGDYVHNIPPAQRMWGNVLVFLHYLCFVLYIIWSKISFGQTSKIVKKTLHFVHLKPMTKKYTSFLLTALTFFVGMITMIPFAILENLGYFGTVDYSLTAISPQGLAGFLYMVIVSSILAYVLFEWALNYVSVGETAITGYVSAMFALPFAYLILGEVPSRYAIIGAVIIAVGVIIAELSAHIHAKSKFGHKQHI